MDTSDQNLTTGQIEQLREERNKIIRLVKNLHMRVKYSLQIDAKIDDVKAKWTRMLDIDLMIDITNEDEIDQLNEQFQNVVLHLENKRDKKIDNSDAIFDDQPERMPLTPLQPNTTPLSNTTTTELNETLAKLSSYLENVEKRLEGNKNIDRKRLYRSLNDHISVSAMLGQVEGDRIDSLVAKAIPSPDEVNYIRRQLPFLLKHIECNSPSVIHPTQSKRVYWEKVFTQQDKPMLIVDGFLFYKEKEYIKQTESMATRFTYFKCIRSKRGNIKCACRVQVDANMNFVAFGGSFQHNHSVDWLEIKKYGFNQSVKRLALDTRTDPDQIYQIAATEKRIQPSDFGSLSQINSIKKRVHFYKQMHGIRNKITRLRNVIFSESEKLTKDGRPFLLYDSREDTDPDEKAKPVFMIWGTEENIAILRSSPHWGGDGTFASCTKVASQFYSVHCSKYPALPLIFAVLPNMKQETYLRLFKKVKQLVGDDKAPLSFIIDFEAGCRNAFATVYSSTLISGCNFHYKQAINRNVKKHTGEFCSGALYFLHYMSYIPARYAVQVYYTLKDNAAFRSVNAAVITYFEKVWIGHYNAKGAWCNPLYSPTMWSIYQSFEDYEKGATTSEIEAFHRAWNTWVESKPRFEDFVTYMQDQQFKTECRIAQIKANSDRLGRIKSKLIFSFTMNHNDSYLIDITCRNATN